MQESFALYGDMVLVRECELAVREIYPSDELKTPVHLSVGEEAIFAGVLSAVPSDTPCFGTYRSHALYLTRTKDLVGFFGELFGRECGASNGKAGSMHLMNPSKGVIMTSAVVGTTIPVAAGYALARSMKKQAGVTLSFFGDGAVEEGVFAETLNFCSLRHLPLLMVCCDNSLAIHAHPEIRRGFQSIEALLSPYEYVVGSGDGYDVQSVREQTVEVLNEMKQSNRPGFLKLNYLRFFEHVGINEDFQVGYRSFQEEWRVTRDPLRVFEVRNQLSAQTIETIRSEVKNSIDSAITLARKSPFPSQEYLRKDVFSHNANA